MRSSHLREPAHTVTPSGRRAPPTRAAANQKYDDRTGHGVNQTSSTSTHLRIPSKQEMDDSKDATSDSGAEPEVQTE
jgi:hypothetical protein